VAVVAVWVPWAVWECPLLLDVAAPLLLAPAPVGPLVLAGRWVVWEHPLLPDLEVLLLADLHPEAAVLLDLPQAEDPLAFNALPLLLAIVPALLPQADLHPEAVVLPR